MYVFYELGINWLVMCEDIFKNGFIRFLILQQLSVRQSVKSFPITKKVWLPDKK